MITAETLVQRHLCLSEWYQAYMVGLRIPPGFAAEGERADFWRAEGITEDLAQLVFAGLHTLDQKNQLYDVYTHTQFVLSLVEKLLPYAQAFFILGIPHTMPCANEDAPEKPDSLYPDLYLYGDVYTGQRLIALTVCDWIQTLRGHGVLVRLKNVPDWYRRVVHSKSMEGREGLL